VRRRSDPGTLFAQGPGSAENLLDVLPQIVVRLDVRREHAALVRLLHRRNGGGWETENSEREDDPGGNEQGHGGTLL
jgi:hypothetical protein